MAMSQSTPIVSDEITWGDLYTESGQTPQCSLSAVSRPLTDSESRRIFQHFARSARFSLLRTAPNRKFQKKLLLCFSRNLSFFKISAKIIVFRTDFYDDLTKF